MDYVEELIRRALVDDFVNMIRDAYTKQDTFTHPGEELGVFISQTIDDLVLSDKLPRQRANRIGRRVIKAVSVSFDPNTLVQSITATWMTPESEYAKKYDDRLNGLGEFKPQFLVDAITQSRDYWTTLGQKRDTIVKRLLEIAKKEGINQATNVQIMHEAFRTQYPLVDDFLEETKVRFDLTPELSSMDDSTTEGDYFLKTLSTVLPKAIELYIGKLLKEEINIIYATP